MTLIHVRRPPQSAMDPDRPVSSLLRTQIEHLHEAEKRLPLRYQSGIYTNAIRTEAEAGEYVRAVTEAIQRAHADAAARRAIPKIRKTRGLEIAATADNRITRRRKTEKKKGKKNTKTKTKKDKRHG